MGFNPYAPEIVSPVLKNAFISASAVLIPAGFLFLMRNRRLFLKSDWKKAVTLFTSMLIPMPIFLISFVGGTRGFTFPTIIIPDGINIAFDPNLSSASGMLLLQRVFLVSMFFLIYIIQICLNYLIVCSAYTLAKNEKAFWIINGAVLLLFFLPVGCEGPHGGAYSSFELFRGFIINRKFLINGIPIF